MPPWFPLFAVLLAAGFVYGYRVWDAPLDRTEPHRALVAHQMVQSGDWLVPHLNGEVYLRKPPLMYWVEAAAEKLTGVAQPWVWRLPSVIGSALLAAVAAAWAGRWFGPRAVVPTGIAMLALLPLFDQDRAADIDALNTAAAVVAALFALEVTRGSSRWPWVAGLAVSTSAMLLLKGPGGLPPLIGALVGPSILLHDWRWVRRPGVWVAVLIGLATFTAWGVAARAAVRHAGVAADHRGVQEALARLVLHRGRDVVPAILAPLTVLAYAVPVSLAIPFAARLVGRPHLSGSPEGARVDGPERAPSGRPLKLDVWIVALLATVGAGLVLFVIAGNGNPRYEYVLLPLLAPLVGAVAAGWDRLTADERKVLRIGVAVMAFVWVQLQGGLTALVWRSGLDHAGLLTAAVAANLALLGWFALRRPAVLLGLVVALLAVPMADRKNLERQRRSTRGVAAELRSVVGGSPVVVASENWDVPELFYYAGVPVRSYGEAGLAKLAADPGGRWVVLAQTARFPEYKTLARQLPDAFPRGVHVLALPKGDRLYVGWYDPPPGEPRTIVMAPAAPDSGDDD